jgi:hypothetical protein
MKLKVLVIEKNPDIACSWYRSLSPLSIYNRVIDTDIQFFFFSIPPTKWEELIYYDVVMFNRPRSKDDYDCLAMCVSMNIKIWVDNDDDVLSINKDNPSADFYLREDTQRFVRTFLNEADLLTFSTPSLAESMGKYSKNGNVVVIPNCWNDISMPIRRDKPSESKNVFWRGGESHRNDTLKYTADIIKVSKVYDDYEWLFMGMDVFWLYENIEKGGYAKGMELVSYLNMMNDGDFGISITPLLHNQFNYGKSNISWMEATMAGAIGVVPDYYDCDNAIKYKEGDFYNSLMNAIELHKSGKTVKLWHQQMDEIKEKYLLSNSLLKYKNAIATMF